MKVLRAAFYTFAILAFIETAFGDGESGDLGSQTAVGGTTAGTGGSVCSQDIDTYTEKRVVVEILKIIKRCLKQSDQDFQAQMATEQIDNARSFFMDYCQKLPKVSECLTEESSKWEECPNDIQSKVFNIVRDVVESSLAKGCVDNGQSLATIFHGLERITRDLRMQNEFVRNCFYSSNSKLTLVLNSTAHPSSKIWFVYHELKTFRDCFTNNLHDYQAFASVAGEHINETIDNMKCIHPRDETVVLCKTIDSSLIDRIKIGPLTRIDQSIVPVSIQLDSTATDCFLEKEQHSPQLKDAGTIEEFRSYFENYCRRHDGTKDCLDGMGMIGDIFLHEPQNKIFQFVTDYLKLAFGSVCLQDGRRLANIFYTVKHRKENSTDQQDALIDCWTEAKGTNAQVQDDASRILQYFQSFPVLKDCLVNKVAGDSAFVDDVESLINEMITKMKCPHPQDGTTVLCKTLVDN